MKVVLHAPHFRSIFHVFVGDSYTLTTVITV